MMNKLSDIKVGTSVRLNEIYDSPLKSKFLELGFTPGQEIIVSFVAPFGDPIAVTINEFTIALRKEEADLLNVEALSE